MHTLRGTRRTRKKERKKERMGFQPEPYIFLYYAIIFITVIFYKTKLTKNVLFYFAVEMSILYFEQ